MKRTRGAGGGWSVNRVVLAAALFLTLFANLAFFRNLATVFLEAPWGWLHLVSVGLSLLCATILLLSAVSFRRIVKPLLTLLFLLSAVTAYFMDTYNVVVDRDMLVNVMATNSAESMDLLTPRLLLYVAILGLLPSVLLWRIRLQPASFRKALGSRLLLAGGAVVLMISLALMSSAFYASFIREHKQLRYYANPLTPIYSAYRYATTRKAASAVEVQPIGEDAEIPAEDVDKELVILVIGETARADHFSLNGYSRQTNPRLADYDVISFKDVSSCGTSTAISVPCMFDIYDRDDFSPARTEATENVLDVLKHAGVSILWRDNNSDSKGVANRVPFEDYRSPDVNPVCDEECRDEGMLADLQQFIDRQGEQDVLIVLHQMGSHGPAYYKRYPEAFRVFAPTCDTSQLDACSPEEIGNAYDNTILYTDHFLAQTIDLLRRNDDRFETVLVYASDHGESLGETGLYLHGLPYWMAPDAQTRVPLIMWFGRNYHDVEVPSMRLLSDQPISHDNIFHTMLGMFEVESEVYDAERDLLQRARKVTAADRPGYASCCAEDALSAN